MQDADTLKLIDGIAEYIKALKVQPPDVAAREAKAALIRTGVLTEDGKAKETIVSWR